MTIATMNDGVRCPRCRKNSGIPNGGRKKCAGKNYPDQLEVLCANCGHSWWSEAARAAHLLYGYPEGNP